MSDRGQPVVRRATVPDLEAVLDVFEATAAEGRWIGTEVPFDRSARVAAFTETVSDPEACFLVADSDSAIVGMLALQVDHGVADLGMTVASGWRGCGVGSALVEAAVDWARQSGAHKVTLQVWPHNLAARNLYRKFGFVDEGRLLRHWRRRNGQVWDAIVMGLVLDETSPGSPFPDDDPRA